MKFLYLFFALFSYSSSVAQDWPNLKKYQAHNLKITETKEYPNAVFIGNSITEGWYHLKPEFFKENAFLGRGIGGQTTPQMLIRFTPDVLDLKPGVVVILAGTNDIAGNTGPASIKMITDNIAAMTQLAKVNGIRVILCSILPVKEYPWSKNIDAVPIIRSVNNWIKSYVQEEGLIYLDFFSEMSDSEGGLKKLYSEDGVHPNKEGYAVMEPLVLSAIKRAQMQNSK